MNVNDQFPMSHDHEADRAPVTCFWSLVIDHWSLVIALAAGIALRLAWPEDMEYKADEAWTFEHARDADFGREVPWLGMESSVGLPNPGMSLWAFIGLQRLTGATEAPGLVRAVQVANCLALVLLVVFALRCVPPPERVVWLWAAALVAVNPLAVLFHRKLWPPCVLPLFTLVMLWGWWRRDRRSAAFIWGLVGACLGQVHMAGFFFAGGFAAWALLFDRKSVAWKAWLAGTLLGAIPLVPWAYHLWTHPSGRPIDLGRWAHALEGKFWVRWVQEPFGLGVEYTLGEHFRDFLSWPRVAGRPTHLMAAAHIALVVAALVLLGRLGLDLWRRRAQWRALWIGKESKTAFTLAAALWGFGLAMTLSGFSIHRHYMIVLFFLQSLWLARLALVRQGGRWLTALWLAQLLISTGLLAYVHDTQRLSSEYGPTWRSQQSERQLAHSK